MDWKPAGWDTHVPGGRYEVTWLVHTQEYEAWFWPTNPRAPGEGVGMSGVRSFASFVDATEACEAHAKARGKLRAV